MATKTLTQLRNRFADYSACKMLLFYEKYHNLYYMNITTETEANLWKIYLEKEYEVNGISESQREFEGGYKYNIFSN